MIMATRDFEGFGLTIIEALNNNVPVITTRLGVAKKIFNRNYPLIFKQKDPHDLSKKLKLFIESKNKDKFITSEIKKNLESYDSKLMSKKYRKYFLHGN